MIIATHHEGDVIHLDPTLDIIVLGVGHGKVKLGLSVPSSPLPAHPAAMPSASAAPESRTATIALVVGKPERSPTNEYVSCTLHNGLLTVRGHAPSYYLSRPGQTPMLIVTCEENQRIRINDAIDIVVLDTHDSQAVRGLSCPSPIRYTARRLVERLRQAQGMPSSYPLDGLPSHAAYSL